VLWANQRQLLQLLMQRLAHLYARRICMRDVPLHNSGLRGVHDGRSGRVLSRKASLLPVCDRTLRLDLNGWKQQWVSLVVRRLRGYQARVGGRL
jgi:hypothetical protein